MSAADQHQRGCRCAGLDRLCPVQYRRSEVEHRREQVEARRRKAEEGTQEPAR
ncbi:hypothetical protein [Nocardioides sp. InS609-2]|uniref:hypothetical protein n=1 Tax=Nocardioides sp. InS609-2 TaxID=2760705 RepID=UPI0020BD8C9F|nr:hypothetical protein [Nocardioides sp. InS609-2]